MPPSQISIATSSVQRLLKEIRSYQQEQQGQEKRLADLQALPAEKKDENWEFEVRQQVSNSPENFSLQLSSWKAIWTLAWREEGGP